MKFLCGFPGWGWRMYGVASFHIGKMWFIGFSKQLPDSKAVVPPVLNDKLSIALLALRRIADCEDAPDIDASGEWQRGLHCGVEDRGCRDRYDGADFGHMVGVEKGIEWASTEAKYALDQVEAAE